MPVLLELSQRIDEALHADAQRGAEIVEAASLTRGSSTSSFGRYLSTVARSRAWSFCDSSRRLLCITR
ncbi:MAG: hypothetical protein ACE5HU_10830 [Acidobacteriota bacterium]